MEAAEEQRPAEVLATAADGAEGPASSSAATTAADEQKQQQTGGADAIIPENQPKGGGGEGQLKDGGGEGPIVEEVVTVTPRQYAGSVEDAKDQLIATLTEELIACKETLARISKEREYYKRKAEWAVTADPTILSPVIQSSEHWYERTWLLLHEPIRGALLDFEDLVMKTPSFDPVKFPWKVANFFLYFKNAFAPYVRRHHEAEEKVYLPWVKTRVEVPARISEGHEALEKLLKDVEQSEVEFKALVKDKAQPDAFYGWRSILCMRLSVLSDALTQHMNEEEEFFPKQVLHHFSKESEAATLEKMGSINTAHIELPMMLLQMEVWGTPAIKDAFLAQLSAPARYTLNQYWLGTFKKTAQRALDSLALEEQPPPTYIPLMSAPQLMIAAPVFMVCSIQ